MSVLAEHELLAYRLHKERGESDLQRNWFDAEEALVRRLAFELSQRPQSKGDADDNWFSARRFIRWREWAEKSGLRNYLALEAGENATSVATILSEIEPVAVRLQPLARCAILLDGAPEYSQRTFELHHGNCVDPKLVIEGRDATFAAQAEMAIGLYEGCPLSHRRDAAIGTGSGRLFQDACVAVFEGDSGYADAIACGWRLRRAFGNHNEAARSAWPEEFHTRIVIGTTWQGVATAVPGVTRDQMLVDVTVFNKLPLALRQVLLADGTLLFDAGSNRDNNGS